MHAEAVVTVVDDEPGVVVLLSVGREVQGEAPMPDDVFVPSLSSLVVLLFWSHSFSVS